MPARTLPRRPSRRRPQQARAHQTVAVVLQAVVKILKREGVSAVTTNRIAEVAGVSVGSVYQYFPNKQAIYLALHDQHVQQITSSIERVVVEHASAPLEAFVRALIENLIDAHAGDPELYELLQNDVPYHAEGARQVEDGLRRALRLAFSRGVRAAIAPRELERRLFIAVHMLDALVHASALRRPPALTLAAAKAEAVRAVLVYVRAP
jgi:AcrR family transcriptional regulator